MKWIKRLCYGLMVIVTLTLAALLFFRESLPVGKKGPDAEKLAEKVLDAIDIEAWNEIGWLKWTFPGGHDYIWNKKENLGIIKWDEYKVHLNLDIVSGQAWSNGQLVQGSKKEKLIAKAWKFWCNDSFWLNPIAKIKDPGTVRSVVQKEGDEPSLLISYQSGGTTPGDSYLYQIGSDGKPIAYKMWVSIIPIGGVRATFEDWVQIDGGAWIATNHKLGPVNLPITNVESGSSYKDIGLEKDPFLFANE